MATLASADGSTFVRLRSEHLVGRSAGCDMPLPDPRVSSTHALCSWIGATWCLRDLASRNGTWVDGEPLPAGQEATLRPGMVIAFGDRSVAFEVVDVSPPVGFAVRAGTGEVVDAIDGILALPSVVEAEVFIAEDGAGAWVVDDGGNGDVSVVADRGLVQAAGAAWTLHLPAPLQRTVGSFSTSFDLEALQMRFAVSRDEEHVDIVVSAKGRERDLGSYSFHYLLLLLARERVKNPKDPEAGWVYLDDLTKMLRCNTNRLNLEVFRARRHFAEHGIVGAQRIVERRMSSRQLRIGVGDLVIDRL